MFVLMLERCLLILLSFTVAVCNKKSVPPPPVSTVTIDSTFTNPILASGPDPWVIQKDTFYYYTHTFGNKLGIFKTSKMSKLSVARLTVVWTPPTGTLYSSDIWAPELPSLQ